MESDYHSTGANNEMNGRAAEDLAEQVAQLRAQLEALQAQVQELIDRVGPAVSDMAGRAEEAMQQAKDFTQAKIDAISDDVRERPLTALLLVAGVGYIVGRVTR